MAPLAVLFDFDGVLADTENIHVAAWQRTFATLGWEMSDETCARAMEMDDRAFLAEVFATHKIEGGDVEGWVCRKQVLTITMLNDSPRVFPGVHALVRALRSRVRLAVVSTTWRANITAVLSAAQLSDDFEVIVGKEDVTCSKPDPEPYTLAVARLGIDPGQAVALEDTAAGLHAARGAGVRAIAVGHRQPRGDWCGESEFIASVAHTQELLALLGLAG